MSGGSKKQTVGYRYYSGDRILLGHDTFDAITEIRWDSKTAWKGEAAFNPDAPGEPATITINKPELFGGQKREGGVSGVIDVLFGHSTQGLHDYLVEKINSVFLPAYRGVTSLVLRHFYVGNNPYIKDLGIEAKRIHRVGDGELQWYDEKAEVYTDEIPRWEYSELEYYPNVLGQYVVDVIWQDPATEQVYIARSRSSPFTRLVQRINDNNTLTDFDVHPFADSAPNEVAFDGTYHYTTFYYNFRRYDGNANVSTAGQISSEQGCVVTPDGQIYRGHRNSTLVRFNMAFGSANTDIDNAAGSGWMQGYYREDGSVVLSRDFGATWKAYKDGVFLEIVTWEGVTPKTSGYKSNSGMVQRGKVIVSFQATSPSSHTLFRSDDYGVTWKSWIFSGGTSDSVWISINNAGVCLVKYSSFWHVYNPAADDWDNITAAGVSAVGANFSGPVIVKEDNTLIGAVHIGSIGLFRGSLSLKEAPTGMNPAHMIREWYTHPVWGRGLPASMIGDSYYTAADTLYAEGLGLSIYWADEITYKDAIAEIQRHIDCVRYTDPVTGKLEIKLIRDDYDPDTLDVLDDSNCTVTKHDTQQRSELYNQITVKYKDRTTWKWKSITVRDDTAIRRLGRVRNKTIEYAGVWSATVALKLARRDLAANSREFAKFRIETNRRINNLKPGDVRKLNSPKNRISGMVIRIVTRTDSADLSGAITVEAAEDIFSDNWSVYAAPTGSRWVDPVGPPQNFTHATAFERPYLLTVNEVGDSYIDQVPAGSCYYGYAGARPSGGAHLNYNLYVYPGGTTQAPDDELAITSEFTPIAIVDGDIDDRSETVIPVAGFDDIASLRVGQLVLIGEANDSERELAAIDAEVSAGDSTVTLKRGVADTLPRPITDGTVLYFIGDQYGGDETEFVAGETADGYGTPINGRGAYSGDYLYLSVDMQGRFELPYPPANFKVDGAYTWDDIVAGTAVTSFALSWNHRDRVLQSNQVITWFEATDYGPEAGQTYRLEVDALDGNQSVLVAGYIDRDLGAVNTYTLDLATDVPPEGTIWLDIRLWAVRDGQDSLQCVTARILTGLDAPSTLAAEITT